MIYKTCGFLISSMKFFSRIPMRFPRWCSCPITVTIQAPLVEQELLRCRSTRLRWHFSGIHLAFVFCVVFCKLLFVFLSFCLANALSVLLLLANALSVLLLLANALSVLLRYTHFDYPCRASSNFSSNTVNVWMYNKSVLTSYYYHSHNV
jgi:hypothetical protein